MNDGVGATRQWKRGLGQKVYFEVCSEASAQVTFQHRKKHSSGSWNDFPKGTACTSGKHFRKHTSSSTCAQAPQCRAVASIGCVTCALRLCSLHGRGIGVTDCGPGARFFFLHGLRLESGEPRTCHSCAHRLCGFRDRRADGLGDWITFR